MKQGRKSPRLQFCLSQICPETPIACAIGIADPSTDRRTQRPVRHRKELEDEGRLYEKDLRSRRTLMMLARPARFERATFGFEDRYSIHLSYGRRLRRTTQKPLRTTNLAHTHRLKVNPRIPWQRRIFKSHRVGFASRDSSMVAGKTAPQIPVTLEFAYSPPAACDQARSGITIAVTVIAPANRKDIKMKLRSSRFSMFAAITVCVLSGCASAPKSGVEMQPPAQVKIYGPEQLGRIQYDNVRYLWVDSWRSAFWLPSTSN